MITFNDLMALQIKAWITSFKRWQLQRRKKAALRYMEVLDHQMRNDRNAKAALQMDVMLIELKIANLR